MKWHREEYLELMTFGNVERQMLVELFGLMVGLEQEWRQQGAYEDETALTVFGLDYVPIIDCGGNTGLRGGVMPCVIEDTAEYRIEIDSLGRKTKLCKGVATIPLPINYPVKNMDDWLKIKPLFEYHEDRIQWDVVEAAQKAQEKGILTTAWIPGGFDLPRELMGEEALCYCYFDNPEVIDDIINTISNTAFLVLDQISNKLIIDNVMVHEDMAGKSGPLIGPDMVQRFIKPYYRRIWDMLSSKGTKLFSQDSDGNMNALVETFIDCGVNVMMPAEPAAGMDIVELRKKFGRKMAFKGGIDKHVLRQGKEAIRKELEYKLQPVMLQGGIAFGLDHRITNGTPLESYKYYINTARELLGIGAVTEKGWEAMAF